MAFRWVSPRSSPFKYGITCELKAGNFNLENIISFTFCLPADVGTLSAPPFSSNCKPRVKYQTFINYNYLVINIKNTSIIKEYQDIYG